MFDDDDDVHNQPAEVSQNLCPAGYYCESDSDIVAECPADNYCPDGSETPTICPEGTYNPLVGSSEATDCIPKPVEEEVTLE